MIDFETYKKLIKKVLLLAGQNPLKEQIEAIYERIKDEYEIEDFIKACDDDELIIEWSIRVNYPALRRVLDKHMSDRIEREERERKQREKRELEEMLRNEKVPEFVKDFLQKIKTL